MKRRTRRIITAIPPIVFVVNLFVLWPLSAWAIRSGIMGLEGARVMNVVFGFIGIVSLIATPIFLIGSLFIKDKPEKPKV